MEISNWKEIFSIITTSDVIPEIPIKDINTIYADDYYDGPLSGMCEWRNNIYFYLVDYDTAYDNQKERLFALIKLSPEQQSIEDASRQRFLEFKGGRITFEEYKSYTKKRCTIENEQLIAWFQSTQNAIS